MSKKCVAIIQARMDSNRLPGKILKNINGIPALSWITTAAKNIIGINEVIVATI